MAPELERLNADRKEGVTAAEPRDARCPGGRLRRGGGWLVAAVARVTSTDGAAAYRNALYATILVFAGAAVLCIGTGPVIQYRFGHDTPLQLDGAWKILWGYRPHVDYYAPFADLECLLIALAMRFTGPTALALPLAHTLFALLLAGAAWTLGRRRFSPLLLSGFVWLVGFVALSVHQLRFPFWETTYATIYNRHGYAVVMVLAVTFFLPLRPGAARSDLVDGILAGILWALLPLIKITFFLVAGGFFACGLILRRPTRRWVCGLLVGMLVTGLPFLVYLGFDLPAYVHDLTVAAGARRGTLSLKQPLLYLWSAHEQWQLLALMGLLVVLKKRSPGDEQRTVGGGWTRFLAAVDGGIWFPPLCFVLGTTFIMSTNAPDGVLTEVPLLAAGALILMECSGRTLADPSQTAAGAWPPPFGLARMHFVVCVLGCFLTADVLGRDVASVVYGTVASIVDEPSFGQSSRFQSESMSELVFVGFAGGPPMPVTYADKINDGLQLLDRNASGSSHVEALDFTNPFPFAAGRPPTRGGPLAWQLGFTFNRTNYPAAGKVFAGVDDVMVPRFPIDPETTRALLEVYHDYLQAHFALQARSLHWVLLRRKRGD